MSESSAATLCKSCGLCCTGHLFVWTKLRAAELDTAQALGLKVFREPAQRGFSQPCPLWDGVCTIYTSTQYPDFCRTYKCKLLKELLNESVEFAAALTVVQQTKAMIAELDASLLPAKDQSFRERLVAFIETRQDASEDMTQEAGLIQKAGGLLAVYETRFGVKDLVPPAIG